MKEFDQLLSRIKDIYNLRFAMSVLGWDQETYMPPEGSAARGAQQATLAGLSHEKICDPRLDEWIEKCNSAAPGELNEDQKVIIREFKRDRDKEIKIPEALVRRFSEAVSKAFHLWVEAKKNSDFASFSPALEEIVKLSKERAEALGYPAGQTPYDALLDSYEPAMTVSELTPIIDKTVAITRKALEAINSSSRKPDNTILTRHYDVKKQAELSRAIMERMGFLMNAGRLDVSEHPFTTNFSARDVRLTTHYDEHYLPMSLYGTMHECGHGLYEQGLPLEWESTPLGESVSLGIHESQSRFWENSIGRSYEFMEFIYPELQILFPEALKGVKPEEFLLAVNSVRPSFIRTESDEVTYNLHIAVRYETELLLFNGGAKTNDLPDIWNSKMKDYLGIVPKNASEGVLQDVHWSHGSFGYFPTYLLGNLYAAQWYAAIRKEIKDFSRLVKKGDFAPILEWLRTNIHHHGRRFTPQELALKCGGKLNPVHFENYLKEKFGGLYQVSW